MASFSSFNLSKELVNACKKLGYVSPSPVQQNVIPKILSGASLVCQSETGSGKTHAYLIPIIERVDVSLPRLQSIIICPSRELARQVYEFAFAFTPYFQKLKVRLFTSETQKSDNIEGLSEPPQIVIGTPGRLADVFSTYELDLHNVRHLVLDEADMLMELGYFDDIDKICEKIPPKTQTMVFSATLEQSLKAQLEHSIGSSFLYEGEANKTSSRVAHHLVNIKHVGVFEALIAFLEIRKPYLAMVFASKKETVNEAASFLKSHGYDCLLFTGDLDVRERKQALRKIKANSHSVIVCSDVLSRGMDIEDVTDVISLDLPTDLTYYFHRAGRTGRFDKSGDSWVFYNADSVAKPKALLSRGVIFDYYVLKGETLDVDPKGLEEKKRVMKSTYSEDENKEIMKARGRAKGQKVRPGYKKKTKAAVEKVKRKYRRKAIQAAVKKHKDETYARKAKKKK